MGYLKKLFIGMLVIFFIHVSFPRILFSDESFLVAKGVTEHKPEVSMTPEVEIPVVEVPLEPQVGRKRGKRLWAVLGLVALGGIAAAGGGGGGGGVTEGSDDNG